MNLAIIGTNNNSHIKTEGFNGFKHMIKIKGENPVERMIRIGRKNGITKVFYMINSHEPQFKHYLSTNNFGVPLILIEQNMEGTKDGFFSLAPTLTKEPFFITNTDSVFLDNEFSEFVTYSLLQADADGIIAVTRYMDNEKPFCVAMNEEDVILKFSDSKDGYSWATGGIYYFSSQILNETKYAQQAGISSLEKFLQLLILRGYVLKGFSFSKIIKVERTSDIAKAEDLIRLNE